MAANWWYKESAHLQNVLNVLCKAHTQHHICLVQDGKANLQDQYTLQLASTLAHMMSCHSQQASHTQALMLPHV